MIIAEPGDRSQSAKKRKAARKAPNVAISPDAIYTRIEAAQAARTSVSSLIRAYLHGCLQGYTVGNRVKHSGQQLLDWLQAGGRTSR